MWWVEWGGDVNAPPCGQPDQLGRWNHRNQLGKITGKYSFNASNPSRDRQRPLLKIDSNPNPNIKSIDQWNNPFIEFQLAAAQLGSARHHAANLPWPDDVNIDGRFPWDHLPEGWLDGRYGRCGSAVGAQLARVNCPSIGILQPIDNAGEQPTLIHYSSATATTTATTTTRINLIREKQDDRSKLRWISFGWLASEGAQEPVASFDCSPHPSNWIPSISINLNRKINIDIYFKKIYIYMWHLIPKLKLNSWNLATLESNQRRIIHRGINPITMPLHPITPITPITPLTPPTSPTPPTPPTSAVIAISGAKDEAQGRSQESS